MPALSGLTLIVTAGVPVPLADQAANAAVTVKAMAGNTGLVYLGNDGAGQVADDCGFQLSAGEEITFDFVGHLASILLDAAVSGEGVTWLILSA